VKRVGCCDPRGCDRVFGRRFADRAAKRYRRKGLDATGARMVAFLRGLGLESATVLEIGGGVGDLQVELLKAGAARATNLELSPAYEDDAAELIRSAGLEGRVERRIHDIAAAPQAIAPADFVILNRVVCCYPDYERLLGAAAEHARRALVFSHPPRNAVSRFVVGAQNLFLRLTGTELRTFAHPPRAMADVLERRGLQRTYERHALVWQVAGFERAAA
jgi:magnesium-protoporphyrin O-methyltransferase